MGPTRASRSPRPRAAAVSASRVTADPVPRPSTRAAAIPVPSEESSRTPMVVASRGVTDICRARRNRFTSATTAATAATAIIRAPNDDRASRGRDAPTATSDANAAGRISRTRCTSSLPRIPARAPITRVPPAPAAAMAARRASGRRPLMPTRSWLEAVSGAPHGHQVPGVRRIVLELLPKPTDVDGHGRRVTVEREVPQLLQDLEAREHPARVRRQQQQHVELLGGQANRLAPALDLAAPAIDLQVVEAQGRSVGVRLPLPLRPPKHRPNASDDLSRREG